MCVWIRKKGNKRVNDRERGGEVNVPEKDDKSGRGAGDITCPMILIFKN